MTSVLIRFRQFLYTSVALLLLLTPLYAETVHHAVHPDLNQAGHHDDANCVVCHFNSGNIASQPVITVMLLPPEHNETAVTITITVPNLAPLYSSAQPRSPPPNA